jgi:hypothetical protein
MNHIQLINSANSKINKAVQNVYKSPQDAEIWILKSNLESDMRMATN